MNLRHVGYAFIGTPKGIQAIKGGTISNLDVEAFVDFKNQQISIFPDSEIYALIRRAHNGKTYHYFVVYRYALEQDSNRLGAFYGAAIAISNISVDVGHILDCLYEMMGSIKVYIKRQDSRFAAQFNVVNFTPPTFGLQRLDQYLDQLKPVSQATSFSSQSTAYTEMSENSRNAIKHFFQSVQRTDTPFSRFDRIYASSDQRVKKAVQEKGIAEILTLPTQGIQDSLQEKISKLSKTSNDLNAKESELRQLNATISTTQSQFDQLKNQQQNELSRLESQIDASKSQEIQLQNNIKDLTGQMTDLTRQLADLSTQLTSLSQDIKAQPQAPKTHIQPKKTGPPTYSTPLHTPPSNTAPTGNKGDRHNFRNEGTQQTQSEAIPPPQDTPPNNPSKSSNQGSSLSSKILETLSKGINNTNWKNILLGLFFIGFIIGIVYIATVFTGSPAGTPSANNITESEIKVRILGLQQGTQFDSDAYNKLLYEVKNLTDESRMKEKFAKQLQDYKERFEGGSQNSGTNTAPHTTDDAPVFRHYSSSELRAFHYNLNGNYLLEAEFEDDIFTRNNGIQVVTLEAFTKIVRKYCHQIPNDFDLESSLKSANTTDIIDDLVNVSSKDILIRLPNTCNCDNPIN